MTVYNMNHERHGLQDADPKFIDECLHSRIVYEE
jgi:hypothetical protein